MSQIIDYATLTARAEEIISGVMGEAAEQPDMNTARSLQKIATGAFWLWESLTRGMWETADHERLLALTNLHPQNDPLTLSVMGDTTAKRMQEITI